jgi:hypothetical protein
MNFKMKGLNIPETDKSPQVLFEPEKYIFEMQGRSRPENVRDFYFPIIYKVRKYFEKVIDKNEIEKFNEGNFKFNFKLDYFNSSSAKFIADILLLVKNFTDEGLKIKVYWYFIDGDEDMKEVGEDFSDMISFPFNYVMVEK